MRFEGSTVRVDDGFGDGKPQAQTPEAARGLWVALLEGIEDFFERLWLKAHTIVANLDANFFWSIVE